MSTHHTYLDGKTNFSSANPRSRKKKRYPDLDQKDQRLDQRNKNNIGKKKKKET